MGEKRRLGRAAARAIEKAETIGVAAISLWEIARLETVGRIAFEVPVQAWLEALLGQQRVSLVPITVEIAVRATQLGSVVPADPADRLIVATALAEGAPLVTKDQRLHDAGVVTTIW